MKNKIKEIVIQEVNSYFNNELLLEYGILDYMRNFK